MEKRLKLAFTVVKHSRYLKIRTSFFDGVFKSKVNLFNEAYPRGSFNLRRLDLRALSFAISSTIILSRFIDRRDSS